MVYDPIKNKFLTFNKGVSRTAKTDVVIAKLEKYFAEKKHYAKITSIYRSPEQQLQVIKDYIKNGVNKKGQIISASPHQTGLAFDIGGSLNGINDEVEVVSIAIANDTTLGIISIVIERANNCLHINCKS